MAARLWRIPVTADDLQHQIDELNQAIQTKQEQWMQIQQRLQQNIDQPNLITHYTDSLWRQWIDYAIADRRGQIEFIFRDGTRITVDLQKRPPHPQQNNKEYQTTAE